MEKLHKIIEKHALKDKVLSPVFLSESEIKDIYTLKSTFTAYNATTKKIESLIQIPLADYSLVMHSLPMPHLNENDQLRLRKAELVLMQKIDIILCSESQKSLRFYSTVRLESCQKHIDSSKNTFICESRDILISDSFDKCGNIHALPEAVVVELDHNTFYFDHPPMLAKITCINETTTAEIKITDKPSKIKLANHCSLSTDLVTISSMTYEKDSIETTSKKFEIYQIPEDYSFRTTQPIPKNESLFNFDSENPDYLDEVNDGVRKVINDETQYEKDFEKNESWQIHFSLFPSILSILIAVLTLANSAAISYFYKQKIMVLENDIKKLNDQTFLGETRDRVQFARIRTNSCADSLAEKLTPFINEKLAELKNEISRQQKSCEFHFSNRFDDQKKRLKAVEDLVSKINQKCVQIDQFFYRLDEHSDRIIDLEISSNESKTIRVELYNNLKEIESISKQNAKDLCELRCDLETYIDNESSLEKELKQLNLIEQKNLQSDEKLAFVSNAVELLLKCIDKINQKLAKKDDDKEYESASLALKECVDQLSSTMRNAKKE